MDELTVLEWLESKQLSVDEIDFLLTFIPNVSSVQVQPSNKTVICESMNKQFRKANLNPEENYLDYEVFERTILNYTACKMSVEELLARMSAQKLCKPLCDFLLRNS